MRRRLEALQDTAKATPPELLRAGRALKTLEMKGGPDARKVLEALASQSPGKWLRDSATKALQRQRGAKVTSLLGEGKAGLP